MPADESQRRFRRNSLALVLLASTLIYLPIAGHHLRADDFFRIRDNTELSRSYFATLLIDNKTDGFYRPLNHLTFGLTHHLFGLNPYPYGWFNFLLVVAGCCALFRLAEELTGDTGFALLACAAWLANVKAVSSVVTWAAGRTTGLYTLFTLLAILAALKARRGRVVTWLAVSCSCVALALLSKESAVVAGLLVALVVIYGLRREGAIRARHAVGISTALAALYAVYFMLRSHSQAMGIASAPEFYRLELSPTLLLRNLLSYLERSLLFSGLTVPLFWIVFRKIGGRASLPADKRVEAWPWLLGFTFVLLPMLPIASRSSLYVYFPSMFVAAFLVALCGLTPLWPSGSRPAPRLFAVALLLVAVAAPVAWRRGYVNHQRHRHTSDWADTIARALGDSRPPAVVIRFDPDAFEGTPLSPMDFEHLETALELRGFDLEVLANPAQDRRGDPRFDLHPVGDSPRLGRIVPRRAERVRATSTGYRLRPRSASPRPSRLR